MLCTYDREFARWDLCFMVAFVQKRQLVICRSGLKLYTFFIFFLLRTRLQLCSRYLGDTGQSSVRKRNYFLFRVCSTCHHEGFRCLDMLPHFDRYCDGGFVLSRRVFRGGRTSQQLYFHETGTTPVFFLVFCADGTSGLCSTNRHFVPLCSTVISLLHDVLPWYHYYMMFYRDIITTWCSTVISLLHDVLPWYQVSLLSFFIFF